MDRVSLGLADNDNDGIADNNSPLQWSPAVDLKTNFSNHGDRLMDRMMARLFGGGATGLGYTIDDLTNNGASLDVLQLNREIEHGGLNQMNLKTKRFRFYIDRPIANGNPSLNCLDCSLISDDYEDDYETIWAIEVKETDNEWSDFIDEIQLNSGKDLRIFFTFSNDQNQLNNINSQTTFNNNGLGFPGFEAEQRYRLYTEYDVCGNFQSSDPNDFTTSKKDSRITNELWLSGAIQPDDAFGTVTDAANSLAALPNPPGSGPASPGITDYVNTHIFWCITSANFHYFLSVDAVNESTYRFDQATNQCNRSISARFFTSIGGRPPFDWFPFEYRPSPLVPSKFTIQKPPFHSFNLNSLEASTRIKNYFLQTEQTINAPAGFSVNSNNPSNLVIDVGCTGCLQNPDCAINPVSSTNWLMGDLSTDFIVNIDITPDQCTDGQTHAPSVSDINIEYNDYSQFNAPGNLSCNSTTPAPGGCSVAGDKNIYSNPADLDFPDGNLVFSFDNNGLGTIAPNSRIEWKFSISNLQNITLDFDDVYHVFLQLPNVIYLSNWEVRNNSGQLLTQSNNIFQIANILNAGNSINDFTISAEYLNCQYPFGPINVGWGWNCLDYPSTFNPTPCLLNYTSLTFDNPTTTLSSDGKVPLPEYTPCDVHSCSADFTSSDAPFYPLAINLLNVHPDLFNISVEIKNCHTCQNYISLSPDPANPHVFPITLQNLTAACLASPGDITMSLGECITVRVNMTPGCNFDGSIVPDIQLEGENYCGAPVSFIADFSAIISPSGYNSCQSCITVEKTPDNQTNFTTIAPYEIVAYTINLCNTINSTGSAVSVNLTDILPTNFVVTNPSPCTWCDPTDTPPVTPLNVNIPAMGCTPVTLEGFYTQESTCSDNPNIAQITFQSANGLPQSVATDIGCVDVSCDGVSDHIWLDGDQASTVTAPAPAETISINGVFTVDINMTLTNCTVYMASNAEIVVTNGATLTLDNTVITGCTSMWSRIHVLSESGVEILNGSIVRDANNAVWAENLSRVTIEQSSFFECVRGLFIPPAAMPGDLHNIGVRVIASTFGRQPTPGFKPSYPGQPAIGTIPNCGIEVHDMPALTIGDYAMGMNRFVNMSNGIIAHRSRGVMIRNSSFENIWPDAAYTSDHNGSAIASAGEFNWQMAGGLSVQPASIQPTITNSNRGIYTNYSSLRASGLQMTGMRTGIFSTRCTDLMTSDVSGCSIEASWRGIAFLDNNGSGGMNVMNNQISLSGNTGGIAISIDESITGGGDGRYRISDNWRIDVTSATGGIVTRNVNRAVIENNYIVQNSDGVSYPPTGGIVVHTGDDNFVSCNEVLCTDPLYTGSFGLFVMNSSNKINCNNFTGNDRGMFFGGNLCASTKLSGNAMQDNFLGLEMNNTAVIGLQDHTGNIWVNNTGPFGAVHNGAFSQSEFRVDQNATPGTIFFPLIPAFNNGWFFPTPGTTFSCPANQYCIQSLAVGEDDAYYRSVATDSIEAVVYEYETKSMARDFLFQKLSVDSLLLESDSVFFYFYTYHDTTITGGLYRVKEDLSMKLLFESTFYSSLATTDSLFEITSFDLLQLDSLHLINPVSNYETQRNQLISELETLLQTRRSITGQMAVLTDSSIEAGNIRNSALIPTELPEINTVTINDVFIRYQRWGRDSIFDSYPQILSIAQQCPYAGGPAVIQARIMISMFNDTMTYNDQAVCLASGMYRYENPMPEQNNIPDPVQPKIKVYPNPANNRIELEIQHSGVTGNCVLEIENAYSQRIIFYSYECNETHLSLITESLQPGVYLVVVKYSNEILGRAKFVIAR
jgi:hypothetical protein